MDATAPEADGGSLLPLLIWLSPSFPVGAFAYSHGLEWAVEAGDIIDARSLQGWLLDLVEFGAPRSDAVLFSVAFRCAAAADWPALIEANVKARGDYLRDGVGDLDDIIRAERRADQAVRAIGINEGKPAKPSLLAYLAAAAARQPEAEADE
jgi:hypothetical protein